MRKVEGAEYEAMLCGMVRDWLRASDEKIEASPEQHCRRLLDAAIAAGTDLLPAGQLIIAERERKSAGQAMSGETQAEDRAQRLLTGIVDAVEGYRAKFGLATDCVLEVLVPDFALRLIADAEEWAASRGLELVPVLGLADDSQTVQVIVFRRGSWEREL